MDGHSSCLQTIIWNNDRLLVDGGDFKWSTYALYVHLAIVDCGNGHRPGGGSHLSRRESYCRGCVTFLHTRLVYAAGTLSRMNWTSTDHVAPLLRWWTWSKAQHSVTVALTWMGSLVWRNQSSSAKWESWQNCFATNIKVNKIRSPSATTLLHFNSWCRTLSS